MANDAAIGPFCMAERTEPVPVMERAGALAWMCEVR